MKNTDLFTNGNIIMDINEPYCVRSWPEVKLKNHSERHFFRSLNVLSLKKSYSAPTKRKSSLKRYPHFKDVQKVATD